MYKYVSGVVIVLLVGAGTVFFYTKPTRIAIENPTVEVKKEGDKYRLYRHGKPYHIKGAAGYEHLEKAAAYGANSIRTWNTQNAGQILDEAHKLGLSVTLGLEVGRQWWGDDFNYWDFDAVDQKIDELKKIVEKYKDHPALLMWGAGNEVHTFNGNSVLILRTIERVAQMIHEVDPNHPVMTTMPLGTGIRRFYLLKILCPDLDILGINGFEKNLNLQNYINTFWGWNKSYILSEWGPPGPWKEKAATYWAAPIELSSSEKAKFINNQWSLIENGTKSYLGGYAFYWGTKYERTHTFFSLFSEEGYETESVQVLQNKWSGTHAVNHAPKIERFWIEGVTSDKNKYVPADSLYQASVSALDADKDYLNYCWELRPEGIDNFKPGMFNYNMKHLLLKENCSTIQFRTPDQEGGYRLFVYVDDGKGHIATHNLPFYVVK